MTGVVWEAVGVVRQWESVRIVANLKKMTKQKLMRFRITQYSFSMENKKITIVMLAGCKIN